MRPYPCEHFSGIEWLYHVREALRGDVISKIKEELNESQRLVGFNQNKIS